MALKGISEIIVYVSDMAAAVEFYRDRLGLEIAWPAGKDDYSNEMWVSFSSGACTLALHGGLELMPKQVQPRFGFAVDDIDAARERLLGAGVVCSEVRDPAPGVRVVDCVDPEGNGFFLEHNEYH
ncbi:MAG: VOC family protein [Planctomycetales bacterium]|nr:VOC family protein [bacterium]UNM09426.1 MAG: VOC family protein [Planctomycetales bacterium]